MHEGYAFEKYYYYYIAGLNQLLGNTKSFQKTEMQGQFIMDYMERGSHARDVYPKHYTSRM